MASPTAAPRSAPTLTDGVVTLRGHRPQDLPAVLRQAVDPEMVRWTRVPTPYTRRDAEDYLQSSAAAWERWERHSFAIEAGGEYAGGIDLRPTGGGAVEIGYALGPWARGRRIMSRSVRLALAWGFDALAVDVVHWQAHVGNWASRRVAWAVGFRIEGTVRGLVPHRDRRVDGWIASLRRGDPLTPAHAWFDPPRLHGAGVTLRPHEDADLPRIVEACNDVRTGHWLGKLPRPYTTDHAAEHLEKMRGEQSAGRAVHWAVTAHDEGPLVGEVAVSVRDDVGPGGEIGYWVHPAARGRGVATAATRLAARHALLPREDGGLGMERLLLRAAAGNEASQRVARGAGFRRAGVDRVADRLGDGTIADHVRFDLLRSELPPATDGGHVDRDHVDGGHNDREHREDEHVESRRPPSGAPPRTRGRPA